MAGKIDRLAGYLNKPFNKVRVEAVLRAADAPMRFREIREAADMRPTDAIRAISWLVEKGVVERWKVPVIRHHPTAKTCMGSQYLYQIVEGK